jgi:flavocytochrome c
MEKDSELRNRRASRQTAPKHRDLPSSTSFKFPWLILALIALPIAFYLMRTNRKPRTFTIVVVGSGLAGLSATVEAIDEAHNLLQGKAGKNIRIVVMEKETNVGGNSAKATSGINGTPTRAQKNQNIQDSVADFIKDTAKSGDGLSRRALIETLAKESALAHDWLENKFNLQLDVVSQCGGHSHARTHREAPTEDGKIRPVGWDLVKALHNHLLAHSKTPGPVQLEFWQGIRMVGLTRKRGIVTGIDYVNVSSGDQLKTMDVLQASKSNQVSHLDADAIILATGGYGADWTSNSLLREFQPNVENVPTTNGPWATGDGVKVLRSIGAELVDMDKVQVHPTGFVDPKNPDAPTKFLAPESLRAHGGILLTGKGIRFVNELDRRDVVTAAIFKHASQDVQVDGKKIRRAQPVLLLNQDGVDAFDPATIGFYTTRGFIKKLAGLQQLAQEYDFDETALQRTLEEYGQKDEFGKTVFPTKFTPADVFYAMRITPAIHYTMGGVAFDVEGRLHTLKGPIAHLYGAGEVTGGLHGANRLAGNSLLECVVFGRRAGKSAIRQLYI